MKRIIITVRDGRVSEVYSNDKDVDVEVIDFDCINVDPEYEEDIYSAVEELANSPDLICVY